MGDRANVKWVDNGGSFHFYTHWTGSDLEVNVANALVRGRSRWDDGIYLSRIVFSEMIKDEVLEQTGYGISTFVGDGGDRIVEINSETKVITDFNDREYTYEEFVKKYATVPVGV